MPTPPTRPIVLATHEYAPFRGGVATYVGEIAKAARSIGVAVEIWTVDYRGTRLGGEVVSRGADTSESSAGAPVVRLASNGRLTPGGLLRLAWGFWRRRAELRHAPVVLLSVGAQMAFFLLWAVGVRVGERVVCVFHGSEILRFSRNRFWRALARKFYRERVSAFAVTTHYVENLLRSSDLLPANANVILAPCALPTTFHVEQNQNSSSPNPATDEFQRILTVARLHPRKGQLEVAKALASLPESRRERIIYQVVGTGDETYRQQVEAACRTGGVRCEFPGAVDDRILAKYYAQATLYVQASRTLPQSVEGFGLTFLEAGIHGCPAVAWRSGGVAEAILDGETGLLADEGDIFGLTKAIERLLADPTLSAKLGAAAQKHARSFSWEQTARVLLRASARSDYPASFPGNPSRL